MNDQAYREIEVKLYVRDLDAVRQRLDVLGARLVSPRVHERNIRYDSADHSMTQHGIILRLRQDRRARLTFKSPGGMNAHGLYERYEAEVEVSDFETMDVILTRLGYQPSMIYEKYRTTYVLHEAEVVLDEMPYGSFVEIEGDEVSIPQALAALALTDARQYDAGYAALFGHVRRNLGLAFRDLTFANFSGILVPESAFDPPKT